METWVSFCLCADFTTASWACWACVPCSVWLTHDRRRWQPLPQKFCHPCWSSSRDWSVPMPVCDAQQVHLVIALTIHWTLIGIQCQYFEPMLICQKKRGKCISINRANSSCDHGGRIWNNPLSYCQHIAVNSFTNVDYKIEMQDDTKHRSPLDFQFLISHRFAFVSCIRFFFRLTFIMLTLHLIFRSGLFILEGNSFSFIQGADCQ